MNFEFTQTRDFRPAGTSDDPTARLLAPVVVTCQGRELCRLHCEAWAVHFPDDVQEPAHLSMQDDWAQLSEAIGVIGPWQTVEINGRDYVLILTPYCD